MYCIYSYHSSYLLEYLIEGSELRIDFGHGVFLFLDFAAGSLQVGPQFGSELPVIGLSLREGIDHVEDELADLGLEFEKSNLVDHRVIYKES